MSFEYRELTTQVYLSAGKKSPGEKPPKEKSPGHCGDKTINYPCPPECQTRLSMVGKKKGDRKKREALAFLRQQLREALAAG